jgi:predicted transcriptional regulator
MAASPLEILFGSKTGAGVLKFLTEFKQGYASEIARYIGVDLFAVQKRLAKFENAGLLTSRVEGRTRCYTFSPEGSCETELSRLILRVASIERKAEPSPDREPLPKHLRPLFWDHPFDRLSWITDRDLIIRRTLTDGSWQAITWLRQKTGDEALRQWLIAHKGRGLSPRQLHFWSLALALTERQVDAWIPGKASDSWVNR